MTRICPNCGSPVAPGERFCGECGTDLNAFPAQPETKAAAPNPDPNATAALSDNNPNASGAAPGGASTTPLSDVTPAYTPPPTNPQGSVYTNTPQPGTTYPAQPAYNNPGTYQTAPQQQTGPSPMFWVGVGLLVFGLVLCGAIFALGMAGASSAGTADDVSNTRLGTWICSIGLLLLLGIPGGLLLFLGRRK